MVHSVARTRPRRASSRRTRNRHRESVSGSRASFDPPVRVALGKCGPMVTAARLSGSVPAVPSAAVPGGTFARGDRWQEREQGEGRDAFHGVRITQIVAGNDALRFLK